jgi:ribonuclease E
MPENKMLIDASHPEETRVVVVRGNRIEEFDFEAQERRQLRGNIYLAKVTRVEPSLQAAFIDYGGNRHGFLAFSEIHPDYYQIPAADRQALLDEEAAAAARESEEEAALDENSEEDDDSESSAGDAPNEDEARAKKSRRRSRRNRSRHRGGSKHGEGDDNGEDSQSEDSEASDSQEDTGDADDNDDSDGSEEADKTIAAAIEMDSMSEPAPDDDSDKEPESGADTETERQSDGETEIKPKRKPRKAAAGRKKPASRKSKASKDEHPDKAVDSEQHAVATEAKKDEADKADSLSDRNGGSEAEGTEAGGEEKEEAPTKKPASRKRGTSRKKRSAKKEVDETPNDKNVDEDDNGDDGSEPNGKVESIGQEDALEEVPVKRPRRQYKIQEVVRRRQIMLVQVVKEERGNKGAALTTYLSLAGRYSVLMPNTARGGGISRKITNPSDRKRLKEVAASLEVPQGMGVILRTAGASRTEDEIKRDFEYLMRLWENVRSLTLESTAPCLVYEEGSLIKRSIRDLYNRDIGEIIVAGEDGYREARDFVEMLMPHQAKNVKLYKGEQPLLSKYNIEVQLDRMLSPQVTLKSGGYLVINQTEALVAIDVNSGRSTREHSIEATALQTNLEAAEEISRQLRLRDLAGLIVIDFIDMEEKRNNRAVERKLKECLKNDRARIQVGHISHFGLLEMSRQRMRASVLESTMAVCPTCQGTGHVRSDSSLALHIVRAIDDHLNRHSRHDVTARLAPSAAIYILNNKRQTISELEDRYGVSIEFDADPTITGQDFTIEKGGSATREPRQANVISPMDADVDGSTDEEENVADDRTDDNDEQPTRKRGRRGGRGRDRKETHSNEEAAPNSEEPAEAEKAGSADETSDDTADKQNGKDRSKSRRPKRTEKAAEKAESSEKPAPAEQDAGADSEKVEDLASNRRRTGRPGKKVVTAQETEANDAAAKSDQEPVMGRAPPRERKHRNTRRVPVSEKEQVAEADPVKETVSDLATPAETVVRVTNVAKEEPQEVAETIEAKLRDAETEDSEATAEKPKTGWRGFFS